MNFSEWKNKFCFIAVQY